MTDSRFSFGGEAKLNPVLIHIGNTSCHITCSYQIRTSISDLLSYEVEGSWFARKKMPYWDGKIRHLSKDNTFPAGLYGLVVEFLKKKGVPVITRDSRDVPAPSCAFKMTTEKTPRYYQVDAKGTAKLHARGVFLMGVGAGKTFTAGMILEEHKVPTLFVVPDTGLRDQSLHDFKSWFGKDRVSDNVASDAPIVIANIQSLMNKDKKFFKRFKQLMIDEFHHSAAKSYQKLNAWCSEAYYRYGFTGTFLRTDGSDMTMHGVLSNVIFKKSASELIEEGFLVRPYITIYRHSLPKMQLSYVQAYDYIVKDQEFNELIAKIARKKIKERKQTLILVRRIEHGETLKKLIPNAYYLSGKDSAELRKSIKKKFIDKKIRCLIATNIFGEGQDIPSIDVLINARCEKTSIQTTQGCGRALRKGPGKEKAEIFDFLITGQKHLQAHSIERIMTYKKEPAFKIKLKK